MQLWNTNHRPDLVEPACRKSLENLGLDYIDLYLMHWPTAYKEGPETSPRDADGNVLFSDVSIEDTYRAMEGLVGKGLVRSIGVSNFNSAQLKRVLDVCTIKPVVNQVRPNSVDYPRTLLRITSLNDSFMANVATRPEDHNEFSSTFWSSRKNSTR